MPIGNRRRLNQDGDRELRTESFVQIIAGVDPVDRTTARFLPVGANGLKVDVGGGIPVHNSVTPTYYGSTNNIHTVVYKLDGDTVGTTTITYVGGGAADNDLIASVTNDF